VREKKERVEANKAKPLASLLTTPDRDYVVNNKGERFNIAQLLQGKHLALYFGGSLSSACTKFAPQMIEAYNQLKAEGKPIEVIFVSADKDQRAFDEYFAKMPWHAVPYADRDTESLLSEVFDVEAAPRVMFTNPDGQIAHNNVVSFIRKYGARAFPFTEQSLEAAEQHRQADLEALPLAIRSARHPHILRRYRSVYGGSYGCDICGSGGNEWAYHCNPCQFDAHVECTKDAEVVQGYDLAALIASLPRTLMDPKHEHELQLLDHPLEGPDSRYRCAKCSNPGTGAVYHCNTCSANLHPDCTKHGGDVMLGAPPAAPPQ
jgi:hypothetical protein